MDAIGLLLGAFGLLVALTLLVGLVLVPVALLVWFVRASSAPGSARVGRTPVLTDDDEIAARHHR